MGVHEAADTGGATMSTYEVTVRGRLSPALASEFAQLRLVAVPRPPETVLRGWLEDQSALHGVLRRVEALGLDLVEVRRVCSVDHGPGADEPPR
jgi:hypothetical protein